MSEPKRPRHGTGCICVSILLFPVVGIVLIWLGAWSKKNKIIGTGIAVVWLLISMGGIDVQPPPVDETVSQQGDLENLSILETDDQLDASFNEAINLAMEASEATQTAQNADEWSSVASLWQESIEKMRAVPESSDNYQAAQQKVVEYTPNLEYAQQNAGQVPASTD